MELIPAVQKIVQARFCNCGAAECFNEIPRADADKLALAIQRAVAEEAARIAQDNVSIAMPDMGWRAIRTRFGLEEE